MWIEIIPISASPRAASTPTRRRLPAPVAAVLAPFAAAAPAPVREMGTRGPSCVHGALRAGCPWKSVMTSCPPVLHRQTPCPPDRATTPGTGFT